MSIIDKIKNLVYLLRTKERIPVPRLVNEEQFLEGKSALITGGSSGIGKAIAEEFLKRGCYVVVAGTNRDKLEKAIVDFENEHVASVVLDLKNVSSFTEKVDDVIQLCPNHKIDILVNCAGINSAEPFLEVQENSFDDVINVNVKGTYFMSQVVAKHMIQRKIKGHILNLSSASSLRPASQPYSISKWAVTGMTKGLADVLVKYGITVNAIAPGPTATPMLGKKENGDINNPVTPIGRYALPEEIARLAAFMVSDMGDLIIGDTFYMTGGSGTISLHR